MHLALSIIDFEIDLLYFSEDCGILKAVVTQNGKIKIVLLEIFQNSVKPSKM